MSNQQPPPDPNQSRWSAILLILVTFVGIPSALLTIFHQFFITYPWFTLGLLLIDVTVALFASIVSRVWQNLLTRWIDRITNWFDNKIQEIVSQYSKQYTKYLLSQYQHLDISKLNIRGSYSLNLNQVFVDLIVYPQPIHRASSNPLQEPQDSQEGGHEIWHYLSTDLPHRQHLVILGPPGSGKTTLLKHIIMQLVTNNKTRDHSQRRIPYKLPILLSLPDHVDVLRENKNYSFTDVLNDHLRKWNLQLPPKDWLKRQLNKGRCLVLLDGLDGIAGTQARQDVVDWIQGQIIAYPTNRFIITSRPFGYQSHYLNDVTVLEVRSFTHEQVKKFIHNWYVANTIMSKQKDDSNVRMQAKADAENLIQRLQIIPSLNTLAINPLLLTIITTVHHYRGSLPGQWKRVDLYTEICEVLLGKNQQTLRQVPELSPTQMQLVLQPLAYYLMLTEKVDFVLNDVQEIIAKSLAKIDTQISPLNFLKLVEHSSGFLFEQENATYRFAHMTFQEYFAAVHIKNESLEQSLLTQVGTSWWYETIRLYCAIAADVTSIVVACLQNSYRFILALTLAIECLQEGFKMQPNVATQLRTLLKQGAEDSNAERQHVVAKVLLTSRLNAMKSLNATALVDTSLVTCAEYQVFLDEQSPFSKPPHWTTTHFPPNQGHLPVLGVRQSDAEKFCSWLTEWGQGTWRYRLPTADEKMQIANKGIIHSQLETDVGYWLNNGLCFVNAKQASFTQERLVRDYIKSNLKRDLSNISSHFSKHALEQINARADALIKALSLMDALHLLLVLTPDTIPDLYIDRDIALTLAITVDRALTYTHDLARNLGSDHNHALNLTIDLVQYLTLARDLARNLNISLARDLAVVLNIATNLDPSLTHKHTIDLALTQVQDIIHKLAHNLTDIRIHLLDLYSLHNEVDKVVSTYSLAQSSILQHWNERLFHRHRTTIPLRQDLQNTIDRCLNIYFSLVIQQGRREGKLPAFEGILLVREQKEAGQMK